MRHLGKVQAFFLQSEQSIGLCVFLHGVKLLVYIFQWKKTLPFYLNQQILTLTDGTTQTRVRFHILLLLSKSAQLFSLLFSLFFIPASSVREIIPPTGKNYRYAAFCKICFALLKQMT